MDVEAVISKILSPLLQADGGDIELIRVDGDEVVVALSGEAAFGAGAHYVRSHVVEPALREAIGPMVKVTYEKRVPKPSTRDSAPDVES